MKDIYIITGYDAFIGQSRKPWVSLNTALFVSELEKLGYRVLQHEFHEVVNKLIAPRNSIIFYSFSHRENLRHYIRDCLMYLQAAGNTLIPSFQLFCCHENKGWQELLKDQLGIHSLDCQYFSSKRELQHYELKFPLVFKTLTGSNSTGVALVNSREDILRELKKHEPKTSLGQRIDFWRRKHLRKNKHFPGYPDYDLKADARWYQDYMSSMGKRLVLTSVATRYWRQARVHASIRLDNKKYMPPRYFLIHDPIASLDSHFAKMQRYARWQSEDLYEKGKRTHWWHLTLRPVGKLLQYYLFRGAFRDGWRGLLICVMGAMQVALKYMLLAELQRADRKRTG